MIKENIAHDIKFNQATIGHAVIDNRTGCFLQVNDRFCDLIGYPDAAAKEITLANIVHPANLNKKIQHIQKKLEGGMQEVSVEKGITREDGSTVWLNLSISVLEGYEQPHYHLVILEDITARKLAEEQLQITNLLLDQRVAERTEELNAKMQELQELNIALKVLIQKQEEVRGEIGEDLLGTIKIAVEPSLKKLAKICPDEKQKKLIAIIEAHLQEVIKPLPRVLASININLSRTETTVADLIKNGLSNKQVAENLNISPETVAFHRKNIRKKLGLTNKETHLAAYLQNLIQG